jgi:hypothetical protein
LFVAHLQQARNGGRVFAAGDARLTQRGANGFARQLRRGFDLRFGLRCELRETSRKCNRRRSLRASLDSVCVCSLIGGVRIPLVWFLVWLHAATCIDKA